MFLGHFGVGFAAKRFAPRTSLGTLFLAAQFVDLLWPTLLVLGVERVRIDPGNTAVTPLDFTSYPVSHSLLAAVGWGVAFALVYRMLRRYPRGAIVCGVAVVSHWVLDLVVHRPDLPVLPGGPFVGFGLWNSLPVTLVLECGLFAAGIAVYARTTRAADRIGTWSFPSLIVFLAAIYAANVLGPPPPSASAIAWAGQAQWLLVAWAYLADRHRILRTAS